VNILFDEDTPYPLRRHLTGHAITTVSLIGWAGIQNGKIGINTVPCGKFMDNTSLIAEARKHVGVFSLAEPDLTAASVSCALVTEAGNVYTGVCLSLACGIGFCAEHSAVAAMLKHRETIIRKIVAVSEHSVLAPCGRCRELMFQVNLLNLECEVILPEGSVKLKELLPHTWL